MMSFTSLLHNTAAYSSLSWHESQTIKGVRYSIKRISLLQRIELTRKARELALQHEFLEAGPVTDRLQASLSDLMVERLYLEWGLNEIHGLKIDGQPATVETLIARGPEALTTEIAGAIRAELNLSEDERKNS